MSWSLQVYLHSTIICMQGTSTHYPEKYLNVHWRNIEKLWLIPVKFSIPVTEPSQNTILSLLTSKVSCAFQWPSDEKRTLEKERVELMNEFLEPSYGHSTYKT